VSIVAYGLEKAVDAGFIKVLRVFGEGIFGA
jgi:hypothetical protein